MSLNDTRRYNQDMIKNYDGLTSFQEVFPDFETWKKWLDKYMFVLKVGETAESIESNIYEVLSNRYKNQYFRYRELSTILTKTAGRYLQLMRGLYVAEYIGENLSSLAGTSTTVETYKTNNTAEDSDAETNTEYRTDIERTFTDNGTLMMDRLQDSIEMASLIQDWMDDFKTMFVNSRKTMIFERI